MTTTTTPPPEPLAPPAPRTDPALGLVGPGRWIERWDADDEAFWDARGRDIARRNLVFSVFAEHIGFSVWLLWSIVVVSMSGTFAADGTLVSAGANGWALTAGQALTVIAVASGVGAVLRIPYTFAVPVFGGRNWTVVSALLLLVPTLGLAWVVQHPEVPFWVLLLVAATAGFGGGNFASSMSNITFFFPDREKGWALGLNAAGGNIGVAIAQKLVPLAIGLGGLAAGLSNAGLLYVPFADRLGRARVPLHGQPARGQGRPGTDRPRDRPPAHLADGAALHRHLRVVHRLLRGVPDPAQGGLRAARHRADVGLPRRPRRLALAAGRRAAVRPARRGRRHDRELRRHGGGRRRGRRGGAAEEPADLLRQLHGAVRRDRRRQRLDLPDDPGDLHPARGARRRARASTLEFRRRAAGAVGIISAVGALGGFVIPFVYKFAKEEYGSIVPALQAYVLVFLALAVLTWAVYVRRGATMSRV